MREGMMALGILAMAVSAAPVEEADFPPVVVLPSSPSALERHAARELAKYLSAMSGRQVTIATEDAAWAGRSPTGAAILVGRTEAGSRALPDDLAPDGFVLKTTTDHGRPALMVVGQSDVATLYAAYHALQELWAVGFMWDGEHVPRVTSWEWPAVDIRAEPHFRIRQNLQGCAFGYTTPYWGWEEWKAEVDWTIKHKFNTMMLPWPSLEPQIWREFGIQLPAPSPYELHRRELMQRVANYARRLGVKCILPAFGGGVPAPFAAQHPEVRLVDVKWGENAAVPSVFPTDPWFRKIGEAFVREYIRVYGSDHIYNMDPYPETRPGANEQEQAEIKHAFAESTVAYLQAADPEAVWYASGWAFLDQGFWPPEAVSDFLAAIPKRRFYVNDIWAEAVPIHERLNYFDGHDWGFSVLHSFGGDDHMHGDLKELDRRVKQVAADPRADRCIAFYINPEMIHYSVLYFELAARLGWNPKEVDIDRYLDEYVDLRYGRDAPATARQAIKALAATVYGPSPGHEPAWQHRPAAAALHPVDVMALGAPTPGLREAAELLLRDRALLSGNPLYERDCVDVARQYAAEVFNWLHATAIANFAAGNMESLSWCTAHADQIMRSVEELLGSCPEYRVQRIVEAALAAPGATPELERAVKDTMLTFAGDMAWLIDYQSKDMQELLAGYDGPRVRAFYEELHSRAAQGNRTPPTAEEMLPKYREIELAWLATPLSHWARSTDEPSSEIAARLLTQLDAIADVLPRLALGGDVRPGEAVGWEEDFDDISDWRETYSGGVFSAENGIATLTSETKWCLVGTRLDVPVADYPILSFRYRSEELAKRGAWLWVSWTDEAGQSIRSLVWNRGLSEQWQEVDLDLEALLGLVGNPVRIHQIELNNQEPPHVSQWDWMELSSRAGEVGTP